ncbi:hypothetical protein MIMGU_mgv11b0237182mg, partial [Erythranthe guttata]
AAPINGFILAGGGTVDGQAKNPYNSFFFGKLPLKTTVSIGQGSTNVCHHRSITQLNCGPGHSISVGSLGKQPRELDVTGFIVKNCTLLGTTNGIRIKTYPASDPSKASGMLNPIIIDQN